jgi:hypothetical protein
MTAFVVVVVGMVISVTRADDDRVADDNVCSGLGGGDVSDDDDNVCSGGGGGDVSDGGDEISDDDDGVYSGGGGDDAFVAVVVMVVMVMSVTAGEVR